MLLKINPCKAYGPDMIPARVLRDLADEIVQSSPFFFQSTLTQGDVPNDWKSANITSIYKTGDRFKAINYRPVSLTSLSCKLQEHIITNNIMAHLEQHKFLTDCQHVFRTKRGFETQLLTLVRELA